jgi:hypothetical protein
LEADPADRFASGAELAEQLDGCRQLRESQRQLPLVPRIFGRILRRPFLWLVALVVMPQLAASTVNIVYNLTQIVALLSPAQKEKFNQILIVYNVFAYPIAIPIFVFAVRPIARCWKSLSDAERVSEADVKMARRQALRLPRLIALLTAYGWFPGGFIFPLVIGMTTGLKMTLACHFVASFVLSGMIALAYSLCGVEFVVLRGLYPGLWRDARHFTAVAREELAPVQLHLTLIQWLAYAFPLVAAIFMLLLVGASNFTFTYRLLVASLIALGIFGLFVAGAVTRHLSRVIVALTKPKG